MQLIKPNPHHRLPPFINPPKPTTRVPQKLHDLLASHLSNSQILPTIQIDLLTKLREPRALEQASINEIKDPISDQKHPIFHFLHPPLSKLVQTQLFISKQVIKN